MKRPFLLFFGFLLLPIAAPAQVENPSTKREMELARSLFQAGEYQLVLEKAEGLLLEQVLNDTEKLEVNKLGGLSCFNLQREAEAEVFFLRMLKINPDFVLDPFAVPPATIRFFENVRKKHASALDEVRRRIVIRPPIETSPSTNAFQYVEKPNFFVNFVPFGVGQFQQGRPLAGVTLAVTETALAATSIAAYFVGESLYVTEEVTLDEREGNATANYKVRGIPANKADEAARWRTIKTVSAIGFYTVLVAGIIESLAYHPTAVKKSVPSNAVPYSPAAPTSISAKFYLAPQTGGAEAGLTFHF